MNLQRLRPLFNLLGEKSKAFYFVVGLISVTNSGFSLLFLAIVGLNVSGKPLPFFPDYDFQVYVGSLVFAMIINMLFERYLIRITDKVIYDKEMQLLRDINATSLESFEKLGQEKIINALVSLPRIGQFPRLFVQLLNSGIICFCCILYLTSASWVTSIITVIFIVLVITVYIMNNKQTMKEIRRIRKLQQQFFFFTNDVVRGFRELKMDYRKKQSVLESHIVPNRYDSIVYRSRVASKYANNQIISKYGGYVLLGIVIFGFRLLSPDEQNLVPIFVICIMYIIPPVVEIVGSLPVFNSIHDALERLSVVQEVVSDPESPNLPAKPCLDQLDTFQSLQFKNVIYWYGEQRQEAFKLGPINLTIHKGSVVVVVGGNGSGKSTFIDVITCLYKKKSGSILYNNIEIRDDLILPLRERIAILFRDGYSFQHNYSNINLLANEEYHYWLRLFQIEQIGEDFARDFSVVKRLSSGQRKRLAIILALLDDRDILILDEWEAEQQETFRNFFYLKILPIIRARKKTIIAITHDQHFADQADHTITFEFGRAVSSATQIA